MKMTFEQATPRHGKRKWNGHEALVTKPVKIRLNIAHEAQINETRNFNSTKTINEQPAFKKKKRETDREKKMNEKYQQIKRSRCVSTWNFVT